jgi:hypothetical protein
VSEFLDVHAIEHAAPYRQLPYYQVEGRWQEACERASRRRQANGLLRFTPCRAPTMATGALFGLPRRRPILPFVSRGAGTFTRGLDVTPGPGNAA